MNISYKSILLFLLFLSFPLSANSQPLSWVRKPFWEPSYSAFAVDSNNYYYTQVRDTLYKSVDQGESWVAVPSSETQHLRVGPDNTLYKFYYQSQGYLSRDTGATWNTIPITNLSDLCFFGDSVVCAIRPTRPTIGLSTDAGNTWSFIDPPFGAVFVYSIHTTWSGSVLMMTDNGILLSSDTCKSWTGGSISNAALKFESLFQIDSTTLLAGTYNGVYRSTDDGVSWDSIAFGGHTISFVCTDRSDNWYAAISSDGNDSSAALYASSDQGKTWKSVFAGAPFTSIPMLCRDRDDNILVSLGRNGIFKIPSFGTVPIRMTTIPTPAKGSPLLGNGPNMSVLSVVANKQGNVFANYAGTMYRTDDSGEYWFDTRMHSDQNRAPSIIAMSNGKTYHVSFDDFYYSSDAGLTWTKRSYPSGTESVPTFLVSPNGDIYIGTSYGSVYRSTNNGISWTGKENILISASLLLECKSGALLLFGSGTLPNGPTYFKSTNKGTSWQALTNVQNKPSSGWVSDLTPWGDLLVVVDSTMFRSTNEGTTWTKTNLHAVIYSHAFHGNEILFGSDNGLILHSKNQGASFTPLSGNLPDARVWSLTLDSSGYLYAYLYNSNSGLPWIYKTASPFFTARVSEGEHLKSKAVIDVSVIPNPTRDKFTLTLSSSATTTMHLYDLLGNDVTSHVELLASSEHAQTYSLRKLGPGIYIYKVIVPGKITIASGTLIRQ